MKTKNHRSTGRHIGSIYPFGHDDTLTNFGTYIGDNVFGNPFVFDPFELYSNNVLTNPNIVVLGQIGRGKSALIKSFIYRQMALGRSAWIIDPKGEYSSLCDALSIKPVILKKHGGISINPLDDAENTIVNVILEARLKRPLNPIENTVIDLVTRYLKESKIERVTLNDVSKLLLELKIEIVKDIHDDFDLLYQSTREIAYCLNLILTKELSGVFDSTSSVSSKDIYSNSHPTVNVIDLSHFFNSTSLDIVMACTISWMQSYISNKSNNCNWFFVIDEAWAILKNFATRQWLNRIWKLSRAYGVSNMAIFHRLSDLANGNFSDDVTKSEYSQIARGILSDSETKIIFSQSSSELELLKATLHLNSTELSLLPKLPRAFALWKVGENSYLVRHLLSEFEQKFVFTDQNM